MSGFHNQSPLVYLIDDDSAVREGLASLLSSVGLRSQGFDDPRRFLAQQHDYTIGCLVLDVRMPGLSGLQVLEEVTKHSDLPVIMLTGHANVDMCRRSFKTGAAEFLEKPVDDDVFLDAVQTAVQQHITSRKKLAATREASQLLSLLSAREEEVLRYVVEGISNKQIARQLGLSPRTVETYRSNVFTKLEADSLAQLIRQYAALLD